MEKAISKGTLISNENLEADNNSKMKLSIPTVIKDEEIDHFSFLVEVKKEHEVACSVIKDEEVDINSFFVETKDLEDLSLAALRENQITSFSIIKPEWGHCKVEPQTGYTDSDLQNEVEPKLMELGFDFPDKISIGTLDRAECFSPEEIGVPVKTETCTTVCEVESQSEIVLDEWKIKHEEVYLKEEELDQNEISASSDHQEKLKDSQTNNLVHRSVKEGRAFSCEECDYKTRYKGTLKRHLLRHEHPKEGTFFKCDQCAYKTRGKRALNVHLLLHNRPKAELKCKSCDFKTMYRTHLRKHLLLHKDSTGEDLLKCFHCEFQTPRESLLKIHLWRHKRLEDDTDQCSPSDHGTIGKAEVLRQQELEGVNVFRCQDCDYISGNKRLLKKHALRHNPKDVDLFQCEKCDFKTIDKWSMRKHTLRHLDPKDLDLYECDKCHFNTRHKWSWKQHTLRHMDPEDVKVFQCDKCEFATLDKWGLKRHSLRHDPKDANMFKCDECEYKSLDKRNLRTHQLRHRDPKEVDMFLCAQCDYKTIIKSNLKRHLVRHQKI